MRRYRRIFRCLLLAAVVNTQTFVYARIPETKEARVERNFSRNRGEAPLRNDNGVITCT